MNLLYTVFALFVLVQCIECHLEWFLPKCVTRNLQEIYNTVEEQQNPGRDIVYENFINYIISHPSKDEDAEIGRDPEIDMTTPELIASHGYISESHTIVTDDGYILTVHRIPHSGKSCINADSVRNTVLLHHGLLGSSADWVIAGPGKSLAYILSDAGYDVWLANVRGNTYSRSHISLNTNDFAFWNFTFHEVSQHDLPAVINYIVHKKGSDVRFNYIGHSMGTTVLFALLSTKTHYNNIIKKGVALAPVAFMTDIRSPIRLLAKYTNKLEFLMKLIGINAFLPQNVVLKWLSEFACEGNRYEKAICENSMFMLCGPDKKEFNETLLPVILGHTPAGASAKTIVHFAQEIHQSGKFQQFDYGFTDNLKAYGSMVPPEYNLTKITLPIALLSSKNDWLAGEGDVANLAAKISNLVEHYIVPMNEFNHLDFLWAKDAPDLVYKNCYKYLIHKNVYSFIIKVLYFLILFGIL